LEYFQQSQGSAYIFVNISVSFLEAYISSHIRMGSTIFNLL
jgi:hypothetical protein